MKVVGRLVIAFSLVSMVLISGCTGFGKKHQAKTQWGSDLPNIEIFQQAYANDSLNQQYQSEANYLSWIKKFYYGTLLQPQGWLSMSQELSASVPSQESAAVSRLIKQLGLKISQEWAKNNKARHVNTKHMLIWGAELRRSVADGTTIALLGQVESDVDQLLAGTLSKKEIVSDRYSKLEFDEFF